MAKCYVFVRHLYLICVPQTTHLVNNAEKSAESYKGRMAQKYHMTNWSIPIVSTSFVDDSVERENYWNQMISW